MRKPRDGTIGIPSRLSKPRQRRLRDGQTFVDRRPPEPIDPAHLASVEAGMEQARREQFAPDEEIDDLYRSAGL